MLRTVNPNSGGGSRSFLEKSALWRRAAAIAGFEED
jgi:hypothetical protein